MAKGSGSLVMSTSGQAALVADTESKELPTHSKFLFNFLDELRQKAPVEK